MNFLVCPAADFQIDDTESLFKCASGNLYNYRVEFIEDEMIRIHDTCGRYMPLDITEIGAMADILNRIAAYTETKAELNQDLIDSLLYGAEQ